MNFFFKTLSINILLSLFIVQFISGQDENPIADTIIIDGRYNAQFGLDGTLINGKKYQAYYSSTAGHQFYRTGNFTKGSLTIKGIKFENCLINYDIFNQLVILKYNDAFGSENIIELSRAWLDDFVLENTYFKVINLDEVTQKIFQVIGEGEVVCFYYWKKIHKLNSMQSSTNYSFSEPQRTSFVMIKGHIFEYKNNRSFIKRFTPENRDLVKSYLKRNKIKVMKASDAIVEQLINYCNKSINK